MKKELKAFTDSQLSDLKQKINERFKALKTKTDEDRQEQVSKQIELDGNLLALEKRLSHLKQMSDIEKDRVSSKIDYNEEQLKTIQESLGGDMEKINEEIVTIG